MPRRDEREKIRANALEYLRSMSAEELEKMRTQEAAAAERDAASGQRPKGTAKSNRGWFVSAVDVVLEEKRGKS